MMSEVRVSARRRLGRQLEVGVGVGARALCDRLSYAKRWKALRRLHGLVNGRGSFDVQWPCLVKEMVEREMHQLVVGEASYEDGIGVKHIHMLQRQDLCCHRRRE